MTSTSTPPPAPEISPHTSDHGDVPTDEEAPDAGGHEAQQSIGTRKPETAASGHDRGKDTREWLQLVLNGMAAIAAVVLYFKYDGRHRALTNELTRLNAQVAAVQRDLNVVALERSRIELEGLKGRKIEVAKTLRVSRGRRGYNVEFQYILKNNGARPIEITNALTEVYVGQLPENLGVAAMINAPLESGPVYWRNVSRRANVTFERWENGDYLETADTTADPRRIRATRGGGGTGQLQPGESSQDGVTMFIQAREKDFVAVLVTITVDDEIGRTFGVVDPISKLIASR